MTNVLIVLCTCPAGEVAGAISESLVQEGLAACVNVIGPLRSVFRWQEDVSHESEMLLIAKTTPERYPALERRLTALHPYEVPEILALPVAAGAAAYLDWVVESVTEPE